MIHSAHCSGGWERPLSTAKVIGWQVEHLRLTAFLAAPLTSAPEWWAGVVGEEPAARTSHPRESRWEEAGPLTFGGSKAELLLRANPIRVDWRLRPIVPEATDLTTIPSLGDFTTASKGFVELLQAWVSRSPAINRLALGVTAFGPEDSYEQAVDSLDRYLPFHAEPSDRDIIFRINRRTEIEMNHSTLVLNRLQTWSIGEAGTLLIALPPQELESRFTARSILRRVELDINNVPGSEPLPEEIKAGLLAVLLDEARHMMDRQEEQNAPT